MEYHINIEGLENPPSLEKVRDLLEEEDPACVVDASPTSSQVNQWRVSTYLSKSDLQTCLQGLDVEINPTRIVQLPSICCGGCSG